MGRRPRRGPDWPYLHPGQEVAKQAFADHRFIVLYCGRRWGKTRFAAVVAFKAAHAGGRVWWIAPTFPVAMIGWRLMRTLARQGNGKVDVSVSDRMFTFPGGGYIQVKSADNPDGLRGEGLDLAILDEAAFMRQDVWTDAIRPALSDRLGKALFCTTPNGLSWVHDLFVRGQFAEPGAEWVSLRFRTTDNPFIPAGEVEAARAGLPAPVFAQEYEAEPLSGDDGVIPLAFVLAAQERWRAWDAAGRPIEPGSRFVLGLDVSEGGGDLTTFALRWGDVVAEVRDETPRERGDMAGIVDKADALLRQHGGAAIVDSIGVGAFIPQALRKRKLTAVSFKASAATPIRDKAGEFGFANVRAAAWWHLREALTPPSTVCIPPDVALAQELTAPHYDVRAGAKIGVEDKDAIRRRIGRSTDRADAVVQSFWDWGTRRRIVA